MQAKGKAKESMSACCNDGVQSSVVRAMRLLHLIQVQNCLVVHCVHTRFACTVAEPYDLWCFTEYLS